MVNKENENEKNKLFAFCKLLNNVLGVTEMTFLTKRAMFHPLKQMGMFLDGGFFFGDDFYFQKVSVLLLYIIIYIIHILQYMFVLRSCG